MISQVTGLIPSTVLPLVVIAPPSARAAAATTDQPQERDALLAALPAAAMAVNAKACPGIACHPHRLARDQKLQVLLIPKSKVH